jgi:hypothetical protein
VLAERFLGDGDTRANIAVEMRAIVKDRYTYGPLLDHLLALMQRRFRERAGVETGDPSKLVGSRCEGHC